MNLEQTLEKIVEHAHEELRIVRKRAEQKTAARDHGKDYHEAQTAADRLDHYAHLVRRIPCSLGSLSDDLCRALVVPEPEKARLSQPSVAGPFGKSDLSDEVRTHPVRAAGQSSRVYKRRLGRRQLP